MCLNTETQIVAAFVALLLCAAFLNVKADDYVSNVVVSPVFEQNNGQIIDAWRKQRGQIASLYCVSLLSAPVCNE